MLREPVSDTEELHGTVMRMLAARNLSGARRLLEEVLIEPLREPLDLRLWLHHAVACRALGDSVAALRSLDAVLRHDPRCFLALLMRGSIFDQMGDRLQAALAYRDALSQYVPHAHYDEPTRRAITRAQQVHDDYQAAVAATLREVVADVAPAGSRDGRRIDGLIGQMTGRRKVYQQQPTHYHLPGLPAVEFYDRALFPWLRDLEVATRDIQREMAAVMTDPALDGAFQPYIHYPDWMPLDQWRPLNNSRNWSAFHLLDKGRPVPGNADRCPATMAVLAQMPQPHVQNRSPAAMFSVLKPHTRIPPHTGVANTRLVVHLPLLVPPGCGFRVGNETREWKVGEAWVFDDTIEHEAWNEGDETRVVLIFDIWHPDLTEAERQAYARIMAALDQCEGTAAEGGL